MMMLRKCICLVAALAMSACAATEPASRNTNFSQIDVPASTTQPGVVLAARPQVQVLASKYTIAEMRVSVPRDLKVSEANSFLPIADIVWRGEPRGDRHAQVAQILNEGLLGATQGMVSGPAVIIEVEVTRFHCLTEKSRFTVGGNHNMRFNLTVRDAASGAVIDGPRPVVADIKAAGGEAAIAEDLAGRTQRVVVVERLTEVIRRELSAPATGAAADAALVTWSQTGELTTVAGL